MVIGRGRLEHDFVEEGLFAVATAAGVLRVFVVVESVVGGLTEVAAAEDECTEGDVERFEKAFPVVASEELRPWRLGVHADDCRYEIGRAHV